MVFARAFELLQHGVVLAALLAQRLDLLGEIFHPRAARRLFCGVALVRPAAWPKAGPSATWSPAVSRPTSRPMACIGAGPRGKIRRQVHRPDPGKCDGNSPKATRAFELAQTANSTETAELLQSSEAIESSSPDHLFLLVIPSSCGESDDSSSREQPVQVGHHRHLNARSKNWVRFVESARATGQDLNARSKNWVRFVESRACGRPACERPARQLGSFCHPRPSAEPSGPNDRPETATRH